MNIGKTIALTIWTFVGEVMSLLFNMRSRLVIAFLLRSKCLLISWLQSPSAVILEPKKIKSVTVFHFPPIYLSWSDGTGYHDLSFLNVEFYASCVCLWLILIAHNYNSLCSKLSNMRFCCSLLGVRLSDDPMDGCLYKGQRTILGENSRKESQA